MTKQHSQGRRQAVNTAATLYPPPVPPEWKHREEETKLSLKRICTLCSPNLHLTLFCKPYPGFLGDSKMLTITSLLAWLCGCVCVCECKATECVGGGGQTLSLWAADLDLQSGYRVFSRTVFFFFCNGRGQNFNVRSEFRVAPIKVKLTWMEKLGSKICNLGICIKTQQCANGFYFWALILPFPTNCLFFKLLFQFPPALFF